MNARLSTQITTAIILLAFLTGCIKVEIVQSGAASGIEIAESIPSLTPEEPGLTEITLSASPKPTDTASPTPTRSPTATLERVPIQSLIAATRTKPRATATSPISEKVVECPGAPPTSIHKLNAWAQVRRFPPRSNNLRGKPGLQGKLMGRLTPGEPIWILDGPRCADRYLWWLVRNLNGLEGWTAEGDATGYWLIQPWDAFFYDTVTMSSTSRAALEEGQNYQITMSGTYSLWEPKQWSSRGVCIRGKSEPRPMYPSHDKINGRVGADPYYRFARPFYGPCQYELESGEMFSELMLSLDGGDTFSVPVPTVAEYRPDHTYTYELTGQGYPLIVQLNDVPLDDNYGQIFITIEKSDEG